MCGRFTLHTPLDKILTYFGLPMGDFEYKPSYNIAPTQQVLTATPTPHGPNSSVMRWGLIPPWRPQDKSGPPLINARLESLTEKRTFRPLVDNSRCLIMADGFYEWKMINGRKQPYYITLQDKQPFAFAGLYEKGPQPSCTIITMDSQSSIQDIHHRMPVILTPEQGRIWLGSTPFPKIRRMILGFSDTELTYYQVSPLVNSPRNDTPSCIEPLEPKHLADSLF